MLRTNIYLEERQVTALDEAARGLGISRAELVRQLVDAGMGDRAALDLEADLDAIDASFGVLGADDVAVERGPDDRSRHLDAVARTTR